MRGSQGLRGVRVVLAGEHEPAEVEPPEAPEDLGARVGAAEADQEQLGDLALDRKPAHEVRSTSRAVAGPAGAGRARRRTGTIFARNEVCSSGLPARSGSAARFGLVRLARPQHRAKRRRRERDELQRSSTNRDGTLAEGITSDAG